MQLVEDMLLTEGNSDSSSSSSSSDQEDDIPSGSSIYDDPIPGPSGVGKKHDLLHNKDNNGIENVTSHNILYFNNTLYRQTSGATLIKPI